MVRFRGGSSGGSRCSSERRYAIKHIKNPRTISLRSSSATSSASAKPVLLPAKGDKSPALKTPRLHSSASSSSATSIAHNEDLIIHILLFLPPKSLLRLQSVSKQWRSVISKPAFRRLHCRKYPSSTSSSFFLLHFFIKVPPLNFISLRQEDVKSMGTFTSRLNDLLDCSQVLLLHSCNGLLCISVASVFDDSSDDDDDDDDDRKLVVFNPTTNQHRIIPREKKLAAEKYRAINIVFDPSKSDHYMLVSCVLTKDKKEFRFKVYSSETGVWSETGVTFGHRGFLYYFERGVIWNGGLHWVSRSSGTLCFDLDNLCLKPVIPHPQNPSSEWCHICFFGESGRHLYFIGLDKSDATLIKVFSLKRDYSGWVVKHCIDIAPLITLYPSMVVDDDEPIDDERFHLDMPCFVVDEKEKEAMPVISIEGKLIAYEINTMTVKEFAKVDFGDLSKCRALNYDWQAAYQHTETLACV